MIYYMIIMNICRISKLGINNYSFFIKNESALYIIQWVYQLLVY